MKLSVVARVSLATLLLMLPAASLFGQSERGSITGVVRDSSGATVPNAKIAIVSQPWALEKLWSSVLGSA